MKRWLPGCLLLGMLVAGSALAAPLPGRTAHIDDTVRLLPPIPGDLEKLETKLAAFESRSGIRILLQFRERSPSSEEDRIPGAYMRTLALRESTLQKGVLVIYFAGESDWRVWIGDELVNRFTGKPGTVKQLSANGTVHNAKEAMLAAAHERADAGIAQLQKTMPGDEVPANDLKLRIQTEAMLDTIIAKFSGK